MKNREGPVGRNDPTSDRMVSENLLDGGLASHAKDNGRELSAHGEPRGWF